MKLSDLIFKNPSRATVTVATPATLEAKKGGIMPTVATVATVSVASPEKTFFEWKITFKDRELTTWFIPMASLAEVRADYPDGLIFEAVAEAPRNLSKNLGNGLIVAACFQCWHCKQKLGGGLCGGDRPDLKLSTALLRQLPDDLGANCERWRSGKD